MLAGERTVAAVTRSVRVRGTESGRGEREAGRCRRVCRRPRALRSMRPRGVGGLRRVFVGRDNELELLRATYRRASAQSEPHLVTLVGEPGVGKSTLVRELWEALATEEPPPVNRTGRCLAYGTASRTSRSARSCASTMGCARARPLEEVEARLAGREILALALGLDVAPDLHPLDARERLHAAAVSFVEELASACPTVVVVEDIHWAEPDLLDLLERLATDVRASRRARCDRSSGGRRAQADLGAREAERDSPLARSAVRRGRVAACSTRCSRRTAGRSARPPRRARRRQPVLPRRARRRARRQRRARPSPETAGRSARADAGFAMPDTVHAVLAARIDRLPALEKAALQAGAVVGRVFWGSSGRPSPRRRGAGLRASRGAGSRRPSVATTAGDDREFVDQARAHARGRIWIDSKGSSRPTARVLRRVARASDLAGRTSARRSSRTTTRRRRIRRRPISSGQAIRKSSAGVRERAVHWLSTRRASLRADGTRWRRRSSSSRAPSSSPMTRHERATALACNRRSACAAVRRRGDASRAPTRGRRSARPMRSKPTRTRSSRSSRRSARRCGRSG